jgi:hypothetical protein
MTWETPTLASISPLTMIDVFGVVGCNCTSYPPNHGQTLVPQSIFILLSLPSLWFRGYKLISKGNKILNEQGQVRQYSNTRTGRLSKWGSVSGRGKRLFSSPQPIQPPIQWVPRLVPSGKVVTHLHPVPRLGICGALPLLLHTSSWCT